MGNAGRVLMIPKGDYNAATTYEMLDFVYYQGRSYVCKQTSTGNVPTNTTYWQALTGDASAEIQALTNEVRGNWATGGVNLLSSPMELGTIDGSGDNSSDNEKMRSVGFIPISQNTTYTYSQASNSSEIWVNYYNNGTYVTRTRIAQNAKAGTFTTPNNANQIRMRCNLATESVLIGNNQLEYGNTATPYQPYAKTNVELTQDVTIENISDSFYDSLETGISVLDAAVYKQGKHIFGSFVVQSTDAFEVSSATAIMTLKYAPIVSINTFFALGNAQWGSVQTLGYMYVNRASKSMTLEVRDADKHFAKIMIDYAIA